MTALLFAALFVDSASAGPPYNTPVEPLQKTLEPSEIREPSAVEEVFPSSTTPATDAPIALVIDAKVPVKILLGGTTLGELFYPAEVRYQLTGTGQNFVRLYTNGQPTDVPIVLTPGGTIRILVGRTGISLEDAPAAPTPLVQQGPAAVELRFIGSGGSMIRLDNKRIIVGPDHSLVTELPVGKYPLSVRSEDGTVIWASGNLHINGPMILQIAEGRLPEVSGAGRFVANGS